MLSHSREHHKPHAFTIPKQEAANLYVLDEHLKQEGKGKTKTKQQTNKQKKDVSTKAEHMPQATRVLLVLIQYYKCLIISYEE